jgi:hypothetical protein
MFEVKNRRQENKMPTHDIIDNREEIQIAHVKNLLKNSVSAKFAVGSIFGDCGIDPSKPIREQEPNPLPDQAELDNIVFDELSLTEEERKKVYWSVCELVKQRLEKARSVKTG